MAEALKHQLGRDLPGRVAQLLASVTPIDVARFERECLEGYDDLEMTPRGRRIADVLAVHLPSDRGEAIQAICDALDQGPLAEGASPDAVTPWVHLPLTEFVGAQGLDHFEISMAAQHRLTRLFTAEFSIRPFIEHHPEATFTQLAEWVEDPSEHVRRLVSEGTRPRLPWAPRLRGLQADPSPVLPLLERLKDDPSEYVRRSVANHLNDIAKDHPEVVIEISGRWWRDGSEDRRRLVRHGLRTLIKNADPAALAIMGFDASSPARVDELRVSPSELAIGDRLTIEVDVGNPDENTDAGALVDLVVHFVKANGTTSPKVFKGAERWLAPHESTTIRKRVSLAQHSTRTHYPGTHRVEAQLNGVVVATVEFELR